MKNIPFCLPTKTGRELEFMQDVLQRNKYSGDGFYTHEASELLRAITGAKAVLLTTSATSALEMAALLLDIGPGDEVIMPSYTFVSTANPFALRGAKIIFIDIEQETMNIDANLVEQNVTSNTKAIVVVHYAGVACDMDKIMEISGRTGVPVVEDAAQAIGSSYKGRSLGTIGILGCLSFHETKNLHCGEGGALLINDRNLIDRAEVIREKGTNRNKFLQGLVDKYTWVDIGSSYLPSELNAAFLYAQLLTLNEITLRRKALWQHYWQELDPELVVLPPKAPDTCISNYHMFYIKLSDLKTRIALMRFLQAKNIHSVFHYIPLHLSAMGRSIAEFRSIDRYTTLESDRLLRLPLYDSLTKEDIDFIVTQIHLFFGKVDSVVSREGHSKLSRTIDADASFYLATKSIK